jgi:hypothetical protein
MEASSSAEMPKVKNDGMDESKLDEDEMEFVKIEREILEENEQKNDEENGGGYGQKTDGINRHGTMEV